MTFTHSPQAHSAIVRMNLVYRGITLSISQLGPDFLILRDDVTMPPGTGEISLQVDASEQHWSVRIPEGIDVAKQKTRIQNLG